MKQAKMLIFLIIIAGISNLYSSNNSFNEKKNFVKKIDHLVFMPRDSKGLYKFMIRDLELPVSWKYRSYGNFESGGAYAGNVVIEAEKGNYKDINTKSKITGIAFEMGIPINEVLIESDKRRIQHSKPIPYFNGTGKKRVKTWTILFFKNLLPGSGMFSVEYHFPKGMMEDRNKSLNKLLQKKKGGPAGIEYVEQVIIMTKDKKGSIKKWENFLSPIKSKNGYFKIGKGPSIQFIQGIDDQIHSFRFKVRSLKQTIKFLKSKNIFKHQKEGVLYTDPLKTYGVNIEFSE